MADHRDPPSSADIAAAGSANEGTQHSALAAHKSSNVHPTLSRLQADVTRPTSAPPGPLASTEEVDPNDIRMKPEYYNWYRAQHPRDPRVPAPAIRWGGPQNKAKAADGQDQSKPLVGLVQMIQEDFPRTPSPVYDTKLIAAHAESHPVEGLQGLGVSGDQFGKAMQFMPGGLLSGASSGVSGMGNVLGASGMQVGVNSQLQTQQQGQFGHFAGMGNVGHPQQQQALGMHSGAVNGAQQQMFMGQPQQQLMQQGGPQGLQMGGMGNTGSVGSVGDVSGLSPMQPLQGMQGMQGMQQVPQGMQMNAMGNVQNNMQGVQGVQGMQQMGAMPMQGMQNMQVQGMQPMQNVQGMQGGMQQMGQQNQMGGQMGMNQQMVSPNLMNQSQHGMQGMQNMQGQFYNQMVPQMQNQMQMGYGNNYAPKQPQDGSRSKIVYMQTPNGVMQMLLDEQTGYAFPVYDQGFQQQQQPGQHGGVTMNGMAMNMAGMQGMQGMQGAGMGVAGAGAVGMAGMGDRSRQGPNNSTRGGPQGGANGGNGGGANRREQRAPEAEQQSELMQRFLQFSQTKNDPNWDLTTLRGHIVEFSKHQEGSRLIQRKLESDTCSEEEKELVFAEVQPEALNLMTDVFGNYVIQKLFEHGLDHHKQMLAQCLKGHVLTLTMQTYGCRVIQKALDVLPQEEKRGVAQELDQHILRCVLDQNGNHVIQKCIESIGPEDVKFIVNAFLGNVQNLAVHAYGCRVIQRILEYCENHHEVIEPILDEILDNVDVLVQDQYGNYVVQHVLTNGKPTYQYAIVERMRHNVLTLSRHKFASNAVEKMFQYCSKESRHSMVIDLLKPLPPDNQSALCQMVKDPYANYVVQRIIETADEGQRRQIIEHIKPQIATLRRYTYGKHIIAKIEKLNASDRK